MPDDVSVPVDPESTSATPAVAAKPKRGRLKFLLIGVVMLLLVVGGAGFMLMRKHHAGPPAPKLTKAAGYFPLTPSIVVNFTDARAIHFLEVGVSLMSHDPAALKEAKADTPRLRNALMLLFSNQTYKTLSTNTGKLTLQKEALAKVRAIVVAAPRSPGIQAVYFTSFVMQ